MEKDKKHSLIAEIVGGLSETDKITYLTLYFNLLSNNHIAYLSGFGDEKTYDNLMEKSNGKTT